MVGVDIIEIERVRKAAEKSRFLERVFAEGERKYYYDNGAQAQTLAGMFCAKEAVVKALGCGFGSVGFADVEVTHTPEGKPYILLHNHAITVASGRSVNISISHCKDYAVAMCFLV